MSDLHGLTARHFMEQFPFVLKDGGAVEALGETIAAALERRYRETIEACLYPRIDELSESVLDLLADELQTPFYNLSFPPETKRRLIKETAMYYKTAGTLGACKRILQAVFPGSSLEEWFDYGGEPYRFRVRAKNDERLREMTGFYEFLRLIDEIKRLAAKLEAVIVEADPIEAPLHIGVRGAIISRLTPTEQADNLSGRQTLRAGGRLAGVARQPPSEQPDNLSGTQTLRTGGRLAGVARQPPSEQPDNLSGTQTLRAAGQPQAVVRLPPAQQADNLTATQSLRTGGRLAGVARQPPTEQPDKPPVPRIVRQGGRPAIVHVLRGREI